ncbi:MAG TPA: CheW domain-containing protein [Pseudomonas sp.]|uniref:CheW domain-containing protein n=1 Tax=Pseudomonas sp. TaxID=306 RepID=UPI002B47F9F6|nr:CheW domain-containing protein [Pseudomonas sp.]HKS12797.1 CheW domain-containing protein [Pseudomonas sp.]
MTRSTQTSTRPQLALQSYLDGLLQEATEAFDAPLDLPTAEPEGRSVPTDEFEAAVREEQARDAQPVVAVVEAEVIPQACVPVLLDLQAPAEPLADVPAPAEPLVDLHVPAAPAAPVPPDAVDGRPAWAAEPFECLLFDVAGLTLAVPLVCLGSIYNLAGQELTPLFGQPDWFLGILPCQAGNLKVLDTARWVMPDRYRDDFRQGLQYVISVQGYEWGLAVHQVSRSLRLDPNEIKWRSQRGQRPWLAGTVIEHMCALLDVAELAELIASGAVKQMHINQ